jgi:hypothetical protein
VTTTTCKTASGSSSSGRGTSDDEEEKILDTDQKRKLASISEDEEEDEEEEGGNPLPTTKQQLEQALDQDNNAFQQLEQQQVKNFRTRSRQNKSRRMRKQFGQNSSEEQESRPLQLWRRSAK